MAFFLSQKPSTKPGQLQKLWVGFSFDSFVFLDCWKSPEDDAVIYCISTVHKTLIQAGFIVGLPVKVNSVFLKVQLPSFSQAFRAFLDTAPSTIVPPAEFENGEVHWEFDTALGQGSWSGKTIQEFVERNERNIKIEVDEPYNGLRVYKIVWAPNGEPEGCERI
ncbi:hypothetical protein ABW20_dc0109909 [Dactylellina cionopaga]|nr:hypothetical protein ABW20_dc0109909 [Dactylellina cionopaga]